MSKQAKNIAAAAVNAAIAALGTPVKAKAVKPAPVVKVAVKAAPVVAAPVVTEVAAVVKVAAEKPAGQGLTFAQYFKLAQNTATGAGKVISEAEAEMAYFGGFKVREAVAAL